MLCGDPCRANNARHGIGVPQGAKFEGLAPRTAKPIVFYVT